jgi:hypothetical protein
MGAFAALTIPLDLSRPGAGTLALAAAQSTAGSTDVAVDVARNELTMKLQLPGNIKSIMTRLKSAGFAIPPRIGAVVPVRSLGLPEMRPDVPHMLAEINASGHVSEARLEGDTLTAVIGPSSKGLYRIFWSLIHAGLIAQDTPTLVALRGL